MADPVVRDFPLFPLGIVALPHELVPLHIFEERYRTMIGECLERGSEFGIVWSGDEGARAVGCAMEIAEVLERMDDGRMNILTRGTRPFRIVDEQHDLAYPAGTVEFVTDKAEHQVEGGYVFTIVGAGFDGRDFHFNDIELITDKHEYAPGEKIQLQVNTNRASSTVLLFVRPVGGVYSAPQVLRHCRGS